jgi:CheY-like chemotaxis protein
VILVVDDDQDLRELMSDVLVTEGYKVASAKDGAEALALLREQPDVSLIFLDLMMPVVSGYEFLQTREADPRLSKIPVVVMSACWEGNEQMTGSAEFLRKPLRVGTILAMASRHARER